MKRMIITLPDDMAKELAKSSNQSETVRQALKVYQEHITTDTVSGIRQAFQLVVKNQQEQSERFVELYDAVERMERTIEELSSR